MKKFARYVGVKFREEVWRAIQEVAKREETTVSQVIRAAVADFLRRRLGASRARV